MEHLLHAEDWALLFGSLPFLYYIKHKISQKLRSLRGEVPHVHHEPTR